MTADEERINRTLVSLELDAEEQMEKEPHKRDEIMRQLNAATEELLKQLRIERTSLLASAAGICGLIAFFFGPAGVLAVILGHIALFRISRSSGLLKGKGLCFFALLMGYMAVALILYHRGH